MKRNVALVLASGGARGIAHIGAIRELENNGYRITSVAGTSMGALVGGIYAAGKMDEYALWLEHITRKRTFELMDFTLSSDGIVKGIRIIEELKTFIPDTPIEQLPIPFVAVATDIRSESETVFDKGSLFDAIRASISIPSLFKPVIMGDKILIDGGVTNPLPLNRVKRRPEDLLVAVDVSAPAEPKPKQESTAASNEESTLMKRLRQKAFDKLHDDDSPTFNYYTLLSQASSVMIQRISALMVQIYKPDIMVSIPGDSYGTLEFYKAAQIINLGAERMREAIEKFESGH